MRSSRFMALALFVGVGVATGCTADDQKGITAVPSKAAMARPTSCDPKKTDCIAIGRMTGGGNTVTVGDVKVTKGLTLHCDILLSNNLEINWPGGNNWHLTKPIETANCVDNPAISPEPPPAPFDTFNGTATGSLNGAEGSYIEFTFVDAGEPGGQNDQVFLRIYSGGPGSPVALEVPLQNITGGNLQAHFDQPHK